MPLSRSSGCRGAATRATMLAVVGAVACLLRRATWHRELPRAEPLTTTNAGLLLATGVGAHPCLAGNDECDPATTRCVVTGVSAYVCACNSGHARRVSPVACAEGYTGSQEAEGPAVKSTIPLVPTEPSSQTRPIREAIQAGVALDASLPPPVNTLPHEPPLHNSFGNFIVTQLSGVRKEMDRPAYMRQTYWDGQTPKSLHVPAKWRNASAYAAQWREAGRRIMSPYFRKKYALTNSTPATAALLAWARQTVVVHFRCSDYPFIRKEGHLQHRLYWQFVARKIVGLGGRRVVPSMCVTHLQHKSAQEHCPRFLEESMDMLRLALPKSIPVYATPYCWGARISFNVFLEADILVSGIESTFSLVAGIAKGKRYISPSFMSDVYEDLDARPSRRIQAVSQLVHWNMYSGPPIFHRYIMNYSTFNLSAFDATKAIGLWRPQVLAPDPRFTQALTNIQKRHNLLPKGRVCSGKSPIASLHVSRLESGRRLDSLASIGRLIELLAAELIYVLLNTNMPATTRGNIYDLTGANVCSNQNGNLLKSYVAPGIPRAGQRLSRPANQWPCLFRPLVTACNKFSTEVDFYDLLVNFSDFDATILRDVREDANDSNATDTVLDGALRYIINKITNKEAAASRFIGQLTNRQSAYLANGIAVLSGAAHSFLLRPSNLINGHLLAFRAQVGLAQVDIALHIKPMGHTSGFSGSSDSRHLQDVQVYFRQASILVDAIGSKCSGTALDPCQAVTVYLSTDSEEIVKAGAEWEEKQNALYSFPFGLNKRVRLIVNPYNEMGDRRGNHTIAETAAINLAVLQDAQFLITSCTMPEARVVASIGWARGTLQGAIAMDVKDLTACHTAGYPTGVWRLPYHKNPFAPGGLEAPKRSGPGHVERKHVRVVDPISTPGNITATHDVYTGWEVLITVSANMMGLFVNWLTYWNRLGLPVPLRILAQDPVIYNQLNGSAYLARVAPTRLQMAEKAVDFTKQMYSGSKGFLQLVSQRPGLISESLHSGRHVLYVDIDTVMMRDPFPYFVGDYDAWIANDFDKNRQHDSACTGLIAVRSTPGGKALMLDWLAAMGGKEIRNQPTFNAALKYHNLAVITGPAAGAAALISRSRQAMQAAGSTALATPRVQLLPEDRFLRGLEMRYPPENHILGNHVVWLHANWVVGRAQKVSLLRRSGVWANFIPTNL